MLRYRIGEKWPRCRGWEKVINYPSLDLALADFRRRTYIEPDDGYKITGQAKGSIRVVVVDRIERRILLEQFV